MENEIEILEKALITYGTSNQVIVAMEELGELISALSRYFFRTGIATKERKEKLIPLATEIADVELCLITLRLLVGNEVVDNERKIKIERLKKRIVEGVDESQIQQNYMFEIVEGGTR